MWVAAAVVVLGVLTVSLVHLFTRPVDPFDPPALLAPSASAPPEATSPEETSPSPPPETTAPESRPSEPSSGTSGESSASPATTAPGNAGLGPEGSVDDAPVLARGDRGTNVLDLQRRLRTAGIGTAPLDGVYGQPTEAAVQNYQALRGIRTDPSGVYGPDTRAVLEAET
ncbi:peptidoglycan-binding domain-containing protein [Streptomyces sp. MN3]